MLFNEFIQGYFSPKSETQEKLVSDLKQIRSAQGPPSNHQYLRSLARTRLYTRTVYPPDWRKSA